MLRKIRIIDKRRSVLNKEKSDLKSQNYVWDKKVYWRPRQEGSLDEYFVAWGPLGVDAEPNFETQEWILNGWEYVIAKDPYMPEKIKVDSKGQYKYKDAVLMKIPMQRYLEIKKEDMKKGDRGFRDMVTAFESASKRDGVEADKDMIDAIVERTIPR